MDDVHSLSVNTTDLTATHKVTTGRLIPVADNTEIIVSGGLNSTGKITGKTGEIPELTVGTLRNTDQPIIFLSDISAGGKLITANEISVGTAEVVLDLEVGGKVEVDGDVETSKVLTDIITSKTGSNNKITV